MTREPGPWFLACPTHCQRGSRWRWTANTRPCSLTKGKKADIVLLNTSNPAFVPLNSVISQLVYSDFPSAVDTVICDGKILKKNGRILVANESKILKDANELLSVFSK